VTLAVGSSPPSSGTLFTLTFAAAYANTPHVVFSPVNPAAANFSGFGSGPEIYVTPSVGGFTLSIASTALTASTTYEWSYVVVG